MTTIPTWDAFMAPSLRALTDGQSRRARNVYEAAADELGVTEHDLRSIEGYVSPRSSAGPTPAAPFVPPGGNEALDPTEQVETGIARIHETVAAELLKRLHGNEPAFFEQAVLDLLIAMGYGGTEGVPPAPGSSATAASTGSSTRTRSG